MQQYSDPGKAIALRFSIRKWELPDLIGYLLHLRAEPRRVVLRTQVMTNECVSYIEFLEDSDNIQNKKQ